MSAEVKVTTQDVSGLLELAALRIMSITKGARDGAPRLAQTPKGGSHNGK